MNLKVTVLSVLLSTLPILLFSIKSRSSETDPAAIVETVRLAAISKNYSQLEKLCFSESDEISKSICSIGSAGLADKDEFSKAFSTLKTAGQVFISNDIAEVPVTGKTVDNQWINFTLILKKTTLGWQLLRIEYY
jgi:hypothetical protein